MDAETRILSVVVPMHNAESWIAECLTSILREQAGVDLEAILVDDGSTDNTFAVADRFAAVDSRVRLLRAAGKGSSAARNQGIAAAHGRYLAFADADDVVAPGGYAALVTALEASGSEVAIGNWAILGPDGVCDNSLPRLDRRSLASIDEYPTLITRNTLWDAIYRRRFWDDAGIVIPDTLRTNDVVPKALALTRASGIEVIPEIVYHYRASHGGNVMTNRATTLAGFGSHLTQHWARAKVVRESASPETLTEAGRNYLYLVGFGHLRAFLLGFTDASAVASAKILPPRARSVLAGYGIRLLREAMTPQGVKSAGKLAIWWAFTRGHIRLAVALTRMRELLARTARRASSAVRHTKSALTSSQ